jgi:hypothetical protein
MVLMLVARWTQSTFSSMFGQKTVQPHLLLLFPVPFEEKAAHSVITGCMRRSTGDTRAGFPAITAAQEMTAVRCIMSRVK